MTELADTLARDHHLSFKTSHRIAARLVQESTAQPDVPPATLLARIASDIGGVAIGYSGEQLAEILSPARFVAVRRTPGGPAPEETARAAKASRERLAQDEAWYAACTAGLRRAEGDLKSAADSLAQGRTLEP